MTKEVWSPHGRRVLATSLFAKTLFNSADYFGYFGPKEIEQVLGIKLDPKIIPPIPFTKKELIRAHERGMLLILFVNKTKNGQPLTMRVMSEQFNNKLGDSKLLGDIDDWYTREIFFTKAVASMRWKLVGRGCIPGPTSKNYLDLTGKICNYAFDFFLSTGQFPVFYREAASKLRERRDDLKLLMESDWKKAAEELISLKMNRFFRETPVEVLYRLIVYYTINHKRLLESEGVWTNVLSSAGRIVLMGDFNSEGVIIDERDPAFSVGYPSVCFSYTVSP